MPKDEMTADERRQMKEDAEARKQLDELQAKLDKQTRDLEERQAKIDALEADAQRAAANAGNVAAVGTVTADHTNEAVRD